MKLNKIALVLGLTTSMSGLAYAQDVDQEENTQQNEEAEKVERIQVTGSSIKRTAMEGDLPLTVISREDIDAQGITSAEQLLLQLNVASNSNDNLASNTGIVSGEERGNNGASTANLRQQGAGSTLVLLNGRRTATHGLKGRSVDLNSIPFSAIERVEVLRDGASAVYGTDAIGGVINFILKKDFQGAQVGAFADHTENGGGNIYRFNVLAGSGDLYSDGYNVMASLSYRKAEILRGVDRDFTNTFQPESGLSPDTRGTPFASLNSRGGGADPNHPNYNLIGEGLMYPGDPDRINDVLNVLALPGMPGCDVYPNMGPDAAELWNRERNSGVSCAWDYPRAAALQQPVDSLDFVARGTMVLSDNAEGFVEVMGSEVTSQKIFEPNQITPWSIGTEGWYPSTGESYDYIVDALSDFYGADQLNIGAPIAYRWRCMDCGNREIETTTKAMKIQFGVEGTIGFWDYRVGLGHATNESDSQLGGGYHYTSLLAEGIGSGDINPFLLPNQSQTQAGMNALAAASAEGVVLYGGKTTMTQFDASITGDTGWNLGWGGDNVYVAGGVDIRNEGYEFNGDRRASADRPEIYGAPFDNANELDDVDRTVKAVFTEALVPVVEDFEMNLAVRYDHYDGFGGTTNPKVGLVWTPTDEVLVRGAYSTGFRTPSFNQLFNGVSEQPYTGQDLADPRDCPGGEVDASDPNCDTAIQPTRLFGGKEDLGPEESKQQSFGIVYAPTDSLSMNLDWWRIVIDGTIQIPGFRDLLENYELFEDNFIRNEQGELVTIDSRYINAGERQTSGIEVGVQSNGELAGGIWNLNFNGSYLIEDKKKLLDNAAWGDNLVGTHSRGNIPLRWKHTIMFNYAKGDFAHNLTQIYRHSYDDETPPGVSSGIADPQYYDGEVGSYLIYNYSVRYMAWDDVDVTFGIKNLFDRDPPFTAHQNDYSPGAAFDPRVADPRGRSYTLQLTYNF
ncbi:Vitamin B12 transporter BtuB [Pseudidiomarina piscicola]|uniref:Vitamin B12 transporter BtuB n=1 Tax=Pseudidiomarina piscicola TaxID=2614830 RepID=A0A6S6WKZ3_9GAMM|nr:TonB-dependent receptor [Pseudidiomarina piscicola]CAB0150722.1 Vitamin B12 transporter BtuB [Pseudidiomarina piscicola]VZT40228.1 Vitamin B12 transporter BtuB [Pseudomonas aeruginosa]